MIQLAHIENRHSITWSYVTLVEGGTIYLTPSGMVETMRSCSLYFSCPIAADITPKAAKPPIPATKRYTTQRGMESKNRSNRVEGS